MNINNKKLNKAQDVMRAIAHPIRLSIISFIDKKKEINVNKIYSNLKLEQSITSQHLRILRASNLVNAKRDGKFIYYSVNYKKIGSIVKSIDKFLVKN